MELTDLDAAKCYQPSDDLIDPDPLSLILEVANLVVQVGSLSIGAVAAVMTLKKMSEAHASRIRHQIFEIDRALTDGFSSLMILASLLQEFNYLERPVRIGGAPIRGHNNMQRLRRAHEDCRAAVRDTRDAFIELSANLDAESRRDIEGTLNELNGLYGHMMQPGQPYGVTLVWATMALAKVDAYVCRLGHDFDFRREPREFMRNLVDAIPALRKYRP
ncbi:MAG: hypothetical protein IT168_10960 [Bryobacterales bacterium]|nr:hypothetical protein [Bryobacterales bacterium]